MAIRLTINLPSNVEKDVRAAVTDLSADARQTYLIDLFRRGLVTQSQLAAALELDRFETTALLQKHGVTEGTLTADDLARQTAISKRVLAGK